MVTFGSAEIELVHHRSAYCGCGLTSCRRGNHDHQRAFVQAQPRNCRNSRRPKAHRRQYREAHHADGGEHTKTRHGARSRNGGNLGSDGQISQRHGGRAAGDSGDPRYHPRPRHRGSRFSGSPETHRSQPAILDRFAPCRQRPQETLISAMRCFRFFFTRSGASGWSPARRYRQSAML